MPMKKFYGVRFYGVRFLGGNRACTTGTPNQVTGRMSVACDIQVFRSKNDREKWLNNEKLSAPTGCGGGERIAATKADCRKLRFGDSLEEFEKMLEWAESSRYDD
jgi:hypothetical protein